MKLQVLTLHTDNSTTGPKLLHLVDVVDKLSAISKEERLGGKMQAILLDKLRHAKKCLDHENLPLVKPWKLIVELIK